ncbi:MAG: M23 family metallopeptidase [Cellvibrionales bacterium]|nr:M23 family metallopeptidase [Cellvibrionales bacterium]
MVNNHIIAFCTLFFLVSQNSAGEIYKYKDQNGNWVFGDKRNVFNQSAKKLTIKKKTRELNRPVLVTHKKDSTHQLIVINPYHAPIDLQVQSEAFQQGFLRKTISANTKEVLYENYHSVPEYKYRWILGDPKASPSDDPYLFPVGSKQAYRITQSFKGRFSHTREPNVYSVDIAMPIGAYISAARAGTVIWVKDDYAMGGAKAYFLDKANYIKVLHDDGTYAVYAHILQGTAEVKPGDTVIQGQKLARAGSSGYSTGPHLHFVIRQNQGFTSQSVPFNFLSDNGQVFTPKAGMVIKVR